MAKRPMRNEVEKAMRKEERAKDVGRDMARLQGRSTSQLEPDHSRGPSSPLGKRRIEGRRR
jgi:hypothetical protein